MTVREGDKVILFGGYGSIHFVDGLSEGKFIDIKEGSFSHSNIIGVKWGTRIVNDRTNKSIVVLRPTMHLMTDVLPHKTQIIYHADIYAIIALLALRPGHIVFESGTGSGSLTCHLAQSVAPHGTVHTFEFHAERAKATCECLRSFGLSFPLICCHHRDVCLNGFGLSYSLDVTPLYDGEKEIPEDTYTNEVTKGPLADALVLDLPQPWSALDKAIQILKPAARVICFSPCIEQVQRTRQWLDEHGFRETRMFEALSKGWATYISKTGHIDQQQFPMKGHTGYLLFSLAPPRNLSSSG